MEKTHLSQRRDVYLMDVYMSKKRGEIKEINEKVNETEFEQKSAVINYGSGPISTYNLVNCLAIGGVFELNGKYGTFLTHESPTDYSEQQNKLNKIKTKLDKKKATIIQIVLFRIDKPAEDVYGDGLTTAGIIDLMNTFSGDLFGSDPEMIEYSCDITNLVSPKCGKAIISPTEYNAVSDSFRFTDSRQIPSEPRGTFVVEVLKNSSGEKIYKCTYCESVTGTLAPKEPTNFGAFYHRGKCHNKNKIPKEEGETKGGKKQRRTRRRKSGRRRTRRRKRRKNSKKNK